MQSNRKQLVATSSKRLQNKLQTQKKLLSATREIMATGKKFNIADVAKQAGVGVATAYRYYSDPERLKSDASLDLNMSSKSGASLESYADLVKDVADPLERLLIAQRQILRFVMGHQADYRMFIAKGHEQVVRARLDQDAVPAGGQRMLIIEAALVSLKEELDDDQLTELTLSLMQVIGPDAFFVLRDYAGLEDEDIFQVAETTICTIYNAMMAKFGVVTTD